MGLTKNLENGAQIVLLYAVNFNWKGNKDSVVERSVLPVTGHVYRAVKDTGSGSYYVSIEQTTTTDFGHPVEGIRINELNYSNSEFDCHMVELNDENIINYTISPEDYRKISEWLDDDHQEFLNSLERKNGINVIVSKDDMPETDPNLEELNGIAKEISKKVLNVIEQSTFTYENISHEAIQFIADRDPWMIETIAGFLVYISRIIEKEDSGVTIPFSREISANSELGKGANMYTAISAIENYLNTNKQIGGNKNSLNKAALHLLLEIVRLKMNNTNEQ